MMKKFGQEDSPSGHSSNSEKLPSGRNSGQKKFLEIQQNCVPAPGSPTPTQASKSAPGVKLGR